jgi:hypothetical protein
MCFLFDAVAEGRLKTIQDPADRGMGNTTMVKILVKYAYTLTLTLTIIFFLQSETTATYIHGIQHDIHI